MRKPTINLNLGDGEKAIKEYPDNYWDLALVDPPYGIKIGNQSLGEGGGLYRKPKKYKKGKWDDRTPTNDYFDELFRVSKNQIIWGGNYYNLKGTSCYIIWDKNNGDSDFADAELAWTSFKSPIRIFKYTWSGFIQQKMGKNKETRIHPTQKPVALYQWLLHNYAKPGNKILDTHLGSGSIAIACWNYGFDLDAYEIDRDYYDAAMKRFKTHTAQQKLF
ncbi:MAG: site-specific DNA-methyltransferase [Bacteroidales bacterium]|nr:site-specific DNA-methyltransferase [Bacteroidales bacterium]